MRVCRQHNITAKTSQCQVLMQASIPLQRTPCACQGINEGWQQVIESVAVCPCLQPYYHVDTALYSLSLYDKDWNLVDNVINRRVSSQLVTQMFASCDCSCVLNAAGLHACVYVYIMPLPAGACSYSCVHECYAHRVQYVATCTQ